MAAAPRTFGQLLSLVRDFLHRHWRAALVWRDRLRLSEETFHLLLAGGVGLVGGLTNLVFHGANQLFKWLVLGAPDDLVDIAEMLSPWLRLVPPALGGLAAGLVLLWGLRLLGSPGLTNLLEVVVAGDGRLRLRTALVNAVSSLLSISTGASIGREGSIIQLSATVASKVGQWAKWQPYRLRLLVACGAASGMAAGCNAPISGAVFAAQTVLGNFSMNLFAPLVFASVVASVVSRHFFGIHQWFSAETFEFTRLTQLPWFLVLGGLAGVAGSAFLKLLQYTGALFNKWPVPIYARIAVAGLIVGAISMAYPQVWGNGYAATNWILKDVFPLKFLAGLFLAKLLATAVSLGAGTVGGVFTPTLFLGAGLGCFFGSALHHAGWGEELNVSAFALVGMGAMLAATTHSPLLAMLMVFELSWNYSLMPALMLACAVSTLTAKRLHPDSIYTEPLRRKGLELERESPLLGAATEKTVGDLMREPVPPLRETTPFRDMADRFLTSTYNFLPVVDAEERLVGVVALHDLKEVLHAGHELNSVIAGDVMRPPPPCLTPNQKLPDVLPLLLASELRNVPVVNNLKQRRLVGTVMRAEALGLLSEAISARALPRV